MKFSTSVDLTEEWKKWPFNIDDAASLEALDKTPVFTTARPRSGQTWIRRMLSDVLNAATQNAPGEPAEWWGDHYNSKWIVRQNHTLEELPGPTLFIYRDPRAVACSSMQYNRQPSLRAWLTGKDGKLTLDPFPQWREYMETWLPRSSSKRATPTNLREEYVPPTATVEDDKKVWAMKYENWLSLPESHLGWAVKCLTGEGPECGMVERAVARQAFEVSHARLLNRYGPTHNSMWRGKADTWQDYFDRELGELFDAAYGDLMLEVGYIESRDWWAELPNTCARE